MSNGAVDRVGASIRRAPYVWLAATVLLFLVVNSPLRAVAKDHEHASTPIALGASAMIAYSVAVWVLWPHVMARSKSPLSRDRALAMRWLLALSAYLVGVADACAGGQQWCYGLGVAVSIVLLVLTARVAHSDAPSAA